MQCPPPSTLARLLDEGPDAALEAHLADCPACAEAARGAREDQALLAELAGEREALAAELGYAGRDAAPGYDVVEELHRGGQGVVYRAEQRSTRRAVALKVLLGGALASPERRRRFEREVELAASLRHPDVVTVFDSGTTRDGRPFFVMELVDGAPIDRFLRERGPGWTVRDTLQLMARVAGAVAYAHRRGVIHRDLKPGNVLVDEAGRPRVLDFGLAKASGADEASLTLSGEFMGTLAYASPEQVSGDAAHVDVRSDVYSLGVMLYEALTGRSPYRSTERMAELVRAIAEDPPEPPSSCSRQRAPGGAVAARRAPRLDRDLDTIVLRALAKEPERRYQSAGELQGDLERYLAGEPIDARRDSTAYVLGKLVRRHRLASAALALLLATVVGASIGLAGLWRRSVHAAERAVGEAGRATKVKELLEGILAAANPNALQRRDVRVRDVLDEAAARLPLELADEPGLLAEMRTTLGEAYLSIGAFEGAERELGLALEGLAGLHGERSLQVAEVRERLGRVLLRSGGRDGEARACFDAVLAVLDELGLGEHPLEARARTDLALLLLQRGDLAAAEPQVEAALALQRRVLGGPHEELASSLHQLGLVLVERGRDDLGVERLAEALEVRRALGQEVHTATAATLRSLGEALFRLGRAREARGPLSEAVQLLERLHGPEHPETLAARVDLALAIARDEGFAAAEGRYRALLEQRATIEAWRHPTTAATLNVLGSLALDGGEVEAAEELLRAALAVDRELGAEATTGATTRLNLANLLYRARRLDEAEELCREALEVERRRAGAQSWACASELYMLSVLCQARRDREGEEALLRECLALERPFEGDAHPTVANALHALGLRVARRAADEATEEEAEQLLRRALAARVEAQGPEHPLVPRCRGDLGALLLAREQYGEAAALLERALEEQGERYPADDPVIAELEWRLGRALLGAGQLDRAGERLESALAKRAAAYGADHVGTLSVANALAEWWLASGDPDEAAARFAATVEALRARPQEPRRVLGEGLAGLARAHLARDEPDAARSLLEEALPLLESDPTAWRRTRRAREDLAALGEPDGGR